MDTTTATARCVYCSGGKAEGPSPSRPVTCMVCKGTGRRPAPICPVCSDPMLDHQPKRFLLGQPQHAIHGATWKVREAGQVEAPCLVRDLVGAAQPTEVSRTFRDGDEVVLVLRLGGEVRLLPWRPVDSASLR